MPLDRYYGGHGRKVMAEMKRQYGPKAERVFYATASKQGPVPSPDAQDSARQGGRRVKRRIRKAGGWTSRSEQVLQRVTKTRPIPDGSYPQRSRRA